MIAGEMNSKPTMSDRVCRFVSLVLPSETVICNACSDLQPPSQAGVYYLLKPNHGLQDYSL